MMSLREVHAVLQTAFEHVMTLRGQLSDDVGTDSAFAIGEAMGVLAKAKALVGRDIDDAASDTNSGVS